MNDPFVYLSGTIVPKSEARISPADRGFLYGDGFFETMRIVNGRPFRLARHLERVGASCRETGWQWTPEGTDIPDAIGELIRRNAVDEGYLRITASRGPHAGPLTELCATKPTVYIDAHAMDLPPLADPPPFVLARASFRCNETSPLVRHKALSYQGNLLALADARRRGADEVYFLNSRGHLTEGAITNLFFVEGGGICTPDVECGLLPGITRETVLGICEAKDIPCETGCYEEAQFAGAEEAFCTNSLRGVVPVREVEGRQIATGPVTARLQRLYADLVAAECGG